MKPAFALLLFSATLAAQIGTYPATSGGGGSPTGAAGGGLTGTYPNPGVAGFTAGAGTLTGPASSGTAATLGANTFTGNQTIGTTCPNGLINSICVSKSGVLLGHSAIGAQGTVDGPNPSDGDSPDILSILTSKEAYTSDGTKGFMAYNNWVVIGASADSDKQFSNASELLEIDTGAHATGPIYAQTQEVRLTSGHVPFTSGYTTYLTLPIGSTATMDDGFYGFGAYAPFNGASLTIPSYYGFYSEDYSGRGITNPYYSWFDSRGVRRVKEDATFDSVGQAIEALYNPQFTKYTPGAVDYERVVLGQWNGNVAEIGNETGGTGTLRPLRLLGAGIAASLPLKTDSASKLVSEAIDLGGSEVTGTIANARLPVASIPLPGTTGSIGGGLLTVGTCTSGTASVTGATTSMTVSASPVTYPGDGNYWEAYVSSANTVTVKVCATATLTPTASNYNVRVLQ